MSSVSVSLDSDDLRRLARAIDGLAEMRVDEGVEVEETKVGEDTFFLDWDNDANTYSIVGIS